MGPSPSHVSRGGPDFSNSFRFHRRTVPNGHSEKRSSKDIDIKQKVVESSKGIVRTGIKNKVMMLWLEKHMGFTETPENT